MTLTRRDSHCASIKYFAHADARWHTLDDEEWSIVHPPPAKRPGWDRIKKGADLCSTHGCILLDRYAALHSYPWP